MKLYQIAEELNAGNRELIDFLNAEGSNVGNEQAGLSDEEIQLLREKFVDAREEKARQAENPDAQEPEDQEIPGEIEIDGKLVVREFAEMLGMKPNRIIAELMKENVFASINDDLEFATAKKIAARHDVELKKKKKKAAPPPEEVESASEEILVEDSPETLQSRAPVVSFLGHVDHGKTSLLDRIRETTVADGEAGGITQHIGAYSVDFQDHRITFLDTPGHAAFTAMRARGAKLTDIVVLIVAADDGVMPQTREAIQHAKAAEVCIIVAANKMDLPGADINKVHQGLMEADLMPEELGGKVGVIPVSAKTGEGIDDLLEHINLESELLELKANPNRLADGYVIEAELEQGRGPTANLLIKGGTLKVGDVLVSGSSWGKIKALINDKGKQVRTAGPSEAVKCMGLNSAPEAGAMFAIKKDAQEARRIADERIETKRKDNLQRSAPQEISLDNLFEQAQGAEKKVLNIILKCDVQGSLEAVEQMLDGIESEKVSLNKALTAIGNITENDILLAKATQAVVLGFNVSKESGVSAGAKREGVEVRLYSVIYELFDEVKQSMTGLVEPEYREKPGGKAVIRQVFDIGKTGKIAGCMVEEGTIVSSSKARVLRDSDVLHEGKLSSLKRFQNDAREVREGQECGIGLDNFSDFEEGDIIECYTMERIEQAL